MANNSKHIFIGIGGSGCQTISQIKEKVYEKRYPNPENGKSRLEAMNDTYRFIFLDTDQRDIDEANRRNRNSFEHGKVPFVNPQTDLVNLGRANPHAIYYEAQQSKNDTLINKRILEACSGELFSKIPDQPLAFGAGAFRIKSRIAFAHSLADFQTKLQAAISALNDVKTVGGAGCTIFYWVVGSSVGGTGSGIFNDVLYHLNMLHHQIVGDGDPQLVYTMYMPKFYIDANATEEKYALNSFGVLQEVAAFKKMSYDRERNTVMHRLAFLNDYNLVDAKRPYRPFYYMIPIDIQTDKGTSLGTTRTMYRNTAEMLYHLHNGQGGDTFRSDIDNYMNDIMEANHENFLVPMGYVSLHKPNEQFKEYIRTRFKRDAIQSWLLNFEEKGVEFSNDQVSKLYEELFGDLDTVAENLTSSAAAEVKNATENKNDEGDLKLDDANSVQAVGNALESFRLALTSNLGKGDLVKAYKHKIVYKMWQEAEKMVREHGVCYAVAAFDKIHAYAAEQFALAKGKSSKNEDGKEDSGKSLTDLEKDAKTITLSERFNKAKQENDLSTYFSEISSYADAEMKKAIQLWKNSLLETFCNDEKNDEIGRVKIHLTRLEDKANEMNAKAKKDYSSLSNKLGNAALDVTTVYLPQLKEICDGNGWKADNFFSKCYKFIIEAKEDKEETPSRKSLCTFLDKVIYNTQEENMLAELKKCQYISYPDIDVKTLTNAKIMSAEEKISEDVRFFAKADSDKSAESIIEGFLTCAEMALDKVLLENPDIQDKWTNKKISDFFDDLSNDKKDEVRRALNPALFFSYNSSRIEVTKKEEHVVFVAPNEDLAREMLGFEKGNPKHRFESDPDINKALVLKSKFGLSLKDYRIYDSLKVVYDKATFREKYFFHHDFAQYQDQITLKNLPPEELPQHRTFAKMLLLNKFTDCLDGFFYKDEFDQENKNYSSSMYIKSKDYDTDSFEVATPEAFQGVSKTDGTLILCKHDRGRKFYDEISGEDFCQQFNEFSERYFNSRYGETLDRLLTAILQHKKKGGQDNGEEIIKKNFKAKHHELLKELHERAEACDRYEERMVYMTIFHIVREKYCTTQAFISNSK